MNTLATRMTIRTANFHVNNPPSISKYEAFAGFKSRSIAPPSVPDGQIYLQNPGTGVFCNIYARGISTTRQTRSTYLN